MDKDFVSPAQIAERWGIPLRTVQSACKTGGMKATKFGRVWMVPVAEAEAWGNHWRAYGSADRPVPGQRSIAGVNVLYRFYGKDDQLLYIGMTMNPPGRFRKHRIRQWWNEVVNITIENFASRETLQAMERLAIQQERPLYNVRYR